MRVSHLKHRTLILAAMLATTGMGATSQTSPPATTAPGIAATTSSTGAAAVSRGDRNFVEEAATGGMMEVEMGKLAQQRASSDQVKQYASRMVTDHSKANDELKAIASARSVQLPTDMPRGQKRDAEKMGKMTGADFDRAYMKVMVGDHKKTVSLFEKEAKSGKDAELKAFAAKTLPTLQEHAQMAQALNDSLKK